MSQFRLLEEIITKLNGNNIQYMLTGSIVSSLQGVPRSTHNIDIIVPISKNDLTKFTRGFPKEEFYYRRKTIEQAIDNKTQFNLISTEFGDMIDFWLLTDSEFDKSRFSRRLDIKFLDLNIFVSSPEDTILEKLLWSKLSGGSKKHFLDALKVYELQLDLMDMQYLEEWAEKLNIKHLLIKVKEELP